MTRLGPRRMAFGGRLFACRANIHYSARTPYNARTPSDAASGRSMRGSEGVIDMQASMEGRESGHRIHDAPLSHQHANRGGFGGFPEYDLDHCIARDAHN